MVTLQLYVCHNDLLWINVTMCLHTLGSDGFGYYLQNDPSGKKNDLVVHNFFALVQGNYDEDEEGVVNFVFDLELAATWKKLAT